MAHLTCSYARTAVPALVTACTFQPQVCNTCRFAACWSTARHDTTSSSSSYPRRQQPYSTQACHAAPDVTASVAALGQPLADDDWLQRSRLLVGADGLAKLSAVNVLLVGLGGVGSFAAEFLCRAGVGSMTIVDGDTVDTTNRNRQLPALKSTVGQLKAEVVAGRLKDINPEIQLTVKQEFLDPIRAAALVQAQQYQYVIDCIDSVAPKHALLIAGHAAGCKVVSSMGAGGRLDPSRVRLADISQTYNDAFAAVVRRGLRKAGVSNGVTVVFSDELAKPASLALTQQQYKKSYFGTSSYIPALFGLYIASHVIRDVVEGSYKLPAAASGAHSSSSGRNAGNGSGKRKGNGRKQQQQPQQQQRQQPMTQAGADGISTEQQRRAATSGVDMHQVVASMTSAAKGAVSQSEQQLQQKCTQADCGQLQGVADVLRSFDKSQGTGMGYDGEGI